MLVDLAAAVRRGADDTFDADLAKERASLLSMLGLPTASGSEELSD